MLRLDRTTNRRGTILFLEFMATLPIFALLMIVTTAFHIYYKHTRAAYAEARLGAWIRIDQHISEITPDTYKLKNEGYKDKGKPIDGSKQFIDFSSQTNPQVSHITADFWEGIATRGMRAPSWLGEDTLAVGLCYVGRDPWAHYETHLKMVDRDNKKVESMPYFFFQPASDWKGDKLKEGFLRL